MAEPSTLDLAGDADLAKNVREQLEKYQAEETRLTTELATIKSRRQNAEKFLASLEGAPKRRRGRPRKTDTPAPAAA